MKTQICIEGLTYHDEEECIVGITGCWADSRFSAGGVVKAQWLLPKVGLLGEFRKKSIVGSWEETVRFPSNVGNETILANGWR
jgi:hypothetical protein